MDETLQYLSKYLSEPELHREVRTGDPLLAGVPEWWRDVLLAPAADRVERTLRAWQAHRPQLASVFEFLAAHLRSVVLLTDKTSTRLLYELEQGGHVMYYAGGNPLKKSMSPSVRSVWDQLPADFRSFYDSLHNGWYYLASHSMGPSPTEDFFILDDLEWGILDDIGDPGCDLKDLLAVYTNGMGGYVALSVGKREYGDVLWWKNKPPRLEINAWAVIDSWTEIGLLASSTSRAETCSSPKPIESAKATE